MKSTQHSAYIAYFNDNELFKKSKDGTYVITDNLDKSVSIPPGRSSYSHKMQILVIHQGYIHSYPFLEDDGGNILISSETYAPSWHSNSGYGATSYSNSTFDSLINSGKLKIGNKSIELNKPFNEIKDLLIEQQNMSRKFQP